MLYKFIAWGLDYIMWQKAAPFKLGKYTAVWRGILSLSNADLYTESMYVSIYDV